MTKTTTTHKRSKTRFVLLLLGSLLLVLIVLSLSVLPYKLAGKQWVDQHSDYITCDDSHSLTLYGKYYLVDEGGDCILIFDKNKNTIEDISGWLEEGLKDYSQHDKSEKALLACYFHYYEKLGFTSSDEIQFCVDSFIVFGNALFNENLTERQKEIARHQIYCDLNSIKSYPFARY